MLVSAQFACKLGKLTRSADMQVNCGGVWRGDHCLDNYKGRQHGDDQADNTSVMSVQVPTADHSTVLGTVPGRVLVTIHTSSPVKSYVPSFLSCLIYYLVTLPSHTFSSSYSRRIGLVGNLVLHCNVFRQCVMQSQAKLRHDLFEGYSTSATARTDGGTRHSIQHSSWSACRHVTGAHKHACA